MKKKTSSDDFSINKSKDKNEFERFIFENDEDDEIKSRMPESQIEEEWEEELLTTPEKIEIAIRKQISLYKRKNEILSRLLDEEQALKKKRVIIKAARKKSEEKKLGKKVTSLINDDLDTLKAGRNKCKELIEHEKAEIEKIVAVVTTLKSLL